MLKKLNGTRKQISSVLVEVAYHDNGIAATCITHIVRVPNWNGRTAGRGDYPFRN